MLKKRQHFFTTLLGKYSKIERCSFKVSLLIQYLYSYVLEHMHNNLGSNPSCFLSWFIQVSHSQTVMQLCYSNVQPNGILYHHAILIRGSPQVLSKTGNFQQILAQIMKSTEIGSRDWTLKSLSTFGRWGWHRDMTSRSVQWTEQLFSIYKSLIYGPKTGFISHRDMLNSLQSIGQY